MPIRGIRNIWPSAGSEPTGILSTRGKQKMDSTGMYAHKNVQTHAHSSSTRSKPSGNGKQGLRHQPPRKSY